jgi:hypothetical protein
VSATYDGRHNKFSADDFRHYIERSINATSSNRETSTVEVQTKLPQWKKPKFIKSLKIRKGSRFLNTNEIALINTVISLFEEAKKETEELYQKFGLGHGFSLINEKTANAFANYLQESKPQNKKFETFIESLSDKELALIESVMYGGRDALSHGRAYTLDEMLSSLEKDTRGSRIHSITEKTSLDLYLAAGLKAYK